MLEGSGKSGKPLGNAGRKECIQSWKRKNFAVQSEAEEEVFKFQEDEALCSAVPNLGSPSVKVRWQVMPRHHIANKAASGLRKVTQFNLNPM